MVLRQANRLLNFQTNGRKIKVANYPAWPAFVMALVALFAKTTVTSFVQIIGRLRARTFLLPEDAALMRVRPVAAEALFVQRCANA